jgi:hypothetical protein
LLHAASSLAARERTRAGADDPLPSVPAGATIPAGGAMQQTITIDVRIEEDETDTVVHAVLNLSGDHFEATGRARRNPHDKPMPVVGEVSS